MLFQICLIFITTMICNSYESDSESITSSQSSRSSRSYSSRNRSNSRDGRNSSIGSRGSSANEWMVLSEFEDLEAASDFLKTVLTKNATRTSTKPNCQFYDPQSAKKHKMHQQIRTCQCSDDCKVLFRFRKCVDCCRADVAQNDSEHIESNLEPERTLRGNQY